MANRHDDDDAEPVNTDGATVQMSGDALARLHRELEKASEAKRVSRVAETAEREESPAAVRAARRAAAQEVEAEPEVDSEVESYDEGGEDEAPPEAFALTEDAIPTLKPTKAAKAPAAKPPAPKAEKAAKPEKPPKAEKPAKPAKPEGKRAAAPAARGVVEVSEGGGGLCVVGGVGALILALAAIFQALTAFGVLADVMDGGDAQLVAVIAATAGHLLLFLGMLGAARATNGLAVLVGVFHLMTVLAGAFLLLLVFGVIPIEDGELAATLVLIVGLIGPTTWLLSGIWGFAGAAGMGAGLAIPYGALALLGGAALVFAVIGPQMQGMDPELIGTIGGLAAATIGVATILLAVAMFGPLKRGRQTQG